jgi:hypothetical protein
MVIEDCISWVWRTSTGRGGDGRALWQIVLGFTWVFAWFTWTMPVWTYPISRKSEGEGILPFSIISIIQVFVANKRI